jgi:hypothetical protein
MKGKRGCLLVGSAADLATFDAEIAQRVTASPHKAEALIVELILHIYTSCGLQRAPSIGALDISAQQQRL